MKRPYRPCDAIWEWCEEWGMNLLRGLAVAGIVVLVCAFILGIIYGIYYLVANGKWGWLSVIGITIAVPILALIGRAID